MIVTGNENLFLLRIFCLDVEEVEEIVENEAFVFCLVWLLRELWKGRKKSSLFWFHVAFHQMSGNFLFGSWESGGKGENCSNSFFVQFDYWNVRFLQFPRMRRNEERPDIFKLTFSIILIINLLKNENFQLSYRESGGKQRKIAAIECCWIGFFLVLVRDWTFDGRLFHAIVPDVSRYKNEISRTFLNLVS